MSDAREFETLLMQRRDEILRTIAAADESVREIGQARGGATSDDEHDPEGSTLSLEWSRIEGLLDAQRHDLREIDDALARIADGTYGRCAVCGRPIPLERLRARPMARTCVACAD